jgi:hypothetical protein
MPLIAPSRLEAFEIGRQRCRRKLGAIAIMGEY